jgi:hypothetical protein
LSRAAAFVTLAFALAGCGTAASAVLSPERPLEGTTQAPPRAAGRTLGDALLYVANYSPAVTVYSYPSGKKVSTLGGFGAAVGVCADAAQNVYITDVDTATIYEYARGRTTPIRMLDDLYGSPDRCAVDPITGNLAVTSDYFDTAGSLLIYAPGSGSAVRYGADTFCHYGFIAYDRAGNLFGDASGNGDCSEQTQFHVFELSPGSKTFTRIRIRIKPKASLPRGLRFQGRHLLIGDSLNGRIDRYAVDGDRARFIDSIGVADVSFLNDFVVTTFRGHERVIGSGPHKIFSWRYPQGGSPITEIEHLDHPTAFALSE